MPSVSPLPMYSVCFTEAATATMLHHDNFCDIKPPVAESHRLAGHPLHEKKTCAIRQTIQNAGESNFIGCISDNRDNYDITWNTNAIEQQSQSDNDTSATDRCGSVTCNYQIKNNDGNTLQCIDSASAPSDASYNPFKSLSALAEQTFNFPGHAATVKCPLGVRDDCGTPVKSCFDNSSPCDADVGLAFRTTNVTIPATFSQQNSPYFHRRDNCDAAQPAMPCSSMVSPVSLQSSSSISPSSSPLSTESCCVSTPTQHDNQNCYSDFLYADSSNCYNQSTHPNHTSQVRDLHASSGIPFSPKSPRDFEQDCKSLSSDSRDNGNNSSLSRLEDLKPVLKKEFSLCSSSDDPMDDSERLLGWSTTSPACWSSSQVLDWLFCVAQDHLQSDMTQLRGENFQGVTGAQLCMMQLTDFLDLEPKFGGLLYDLYKSLRCCEGMMNKSPEQTMASPCPQLSPQTPQQQNSPHTSPQRATTMSPYLSKQPSPPMYPVTSHLGINTPNAGGATEMFFKEEQNSAMLSNGNIDITSYDFDLDDTPCISSDQCAEPYPADYNTYIYPVQYSQSLHVQHSSPGFHAPSFPVQVPRRRPGRPKVKGLIEDGRSAKEKKVKSQHLWEFIYETLMNPLYNPQYLRWENQRDGVFRFMQSEAVAQLWGGRKNNENMTYEKLSRAMRHYYKRGILERVEGRRLVYKFSMKAMDKVRDKRLAAAVSS